MKVNKLKRMVICIIAVAMVFTVSVPASYAASDTYGAGGRNEFELHNFTDAEKAEFERLLSNLHYNFNMEHPELNLVNEVKWRTDLEYVSKVKLQYQFNTYLKYGEYYPHIYHMDNNARNELIPKMNGYFLDTEGYTLTSGKPPYFYLENESLLCASYPLDADKEYIENLLVGYLTERDNPYTKDVIKSYPDGDVPVSEIPDSAVGHAAALLGAKGIGSAYSLFNADTLNGMDYGMHEILTFEGSDLNRSLNNDTLLYKYAKEDLFLNEDYVRELLEDYVPATMKIQIGSLELDGQKSDEGYKYTYTGKYIYPKLIVKDINGEVVPEDQYTVNYKAMKNVGICKFTVTGKGEYKGEASARMIILPKPASGLKVKLGAYSGGYNDLNISWNKQQGANGYAVYYKLHSQKKWKYICRTTKNSYVKKNLPGGKAYDVRVIPYMTRGDKRYYSLTTRSVYNKYTLKKINRPVIKKYKSGYVRVKWDNIPGETGYQVVRATSKDGRYRKLASHYSKTRSSAVYKTTKNRRYYYKVRAFKKEADGKYVYGLWSEPVSYVLR